MGFWGGLAIGVVLCFVLVLVFDKPETVINGKNKAKNGGVVNFKPNTNGFFSKFKNRRKRK